MALSGLLTLAGVCAWTADAAGLLETGARARYVHRVSLYDGDGKLIRSGDPQPMPYSTAATCGKCHDYQTIRGGWHFNAGREGVDAGRPGEPWLYVDAATATQIPLSYRSWPGAHKPAELGLSEWDFTLRFGRQLPGGGVAEPADPKGRWKVAGPLQIDCLHCHAAQFDFDPAAQEDQLAKQNFRYSPSVTAHLADVRGDTKGLSDQWTPRFGDLTNPEAKSPTVKYYRDRFDANETVFLDITRRMDTQRCYFCHSFRNVGEQAEETWRRDRDVHLAAGMTCADCHRNGLDHNIARGYQTDARSAGANLSCRSCHYGEPQSQDPITQLGRRMGAPRPDHAGLPAIHLQSLSCTACHSGPWPTQEPRRVQTSLAHGLGLTSESRTADTLPIIQAPLFVRGQSEQIEPHRAVWPAYWARRKDGVVTAIPVAQLPKTLTDALNPPQVEGQTLPAEQPGTSKIEAALKALGPAEAGEPVYIGNGRVHALDAAGRLTMDAEDSAGQAKPYTWALAHDVRPAAQSLGVRSCQDCHADDAAFMFSSVQPLGPTRADEATRAPMAGLERLDASYHRMFAWSFAFRPVLKVLGFICSGVVLVVLLLYGLKGLSAVMSGHRAVSEASVDSSARRLWNGLVYLALAGTFTALAVTGFLPLVRDGAVRGHWLMVHTTCGGAFAVSLALAVLSWAHRCRLTTIVATDRAARPIERAQRVCFWMMAVLAVGSLLSMLLSMTPLVGTDALELLRQVHLYCGIALLAVAVIHLASLKHGPSSAGPRHRRP